MAHNLGLHMDCSTWVATGLISEDEAEVRKVTWWGCFVVDKLFACGLGRPSSIQRSGVTCPKPTIDREEYSPWMPKTDGLEVTTSLGAHSHIASTAHFVSECMAIACEALELIRLAAKDIEGIVSKADVDLRAYYTALPTYLRLPSSPKVSALPHIYLAQPLIQKKRGRRRTNDSSATDSAASPGESLYLNQHMEICRHSAAQISRLMHVYKQHYTLRQIPIAAVHLSFAAAVIHLIDARPTNPNWDQAVRHLKTCVDALKDLRTPWCAWADRSLRGVHLLALDWYQCDDVSQLKKDRHSGEDDVSHTLLTATCVHMPEATSPNQADDGGYSTSWGHSKSRLHTVDETEGYAAPSNISGRPEPENFWASLFEHTDADLDMNGMVREWLSDRWYDWSLTEFEAGGSGGNPNEL
ncbi:unnamed protein product [Clonostachys chloroleuca]|uniref:Xylanolytic transcriptional activator regulatory domain-containing protein n=1 Tax=Clonostachys chloroleuca TaxID=1926264 RepID=A0AA35LSV8_9HYPO|nr:unnamed protein product [Clonostachys chloroleuca]